MTVNDMKPRIGTDCRMSSSGTSTIRAPALGRERGISEGEQQREQPCRQHAQRRAQRILGQMRMIERQGGCFGRVERGGHPARPVAHQNQDAEHQNERGEIHKIGKISAAGFSKYGETFLRHAAIQSGSVILGRRREAKGCWRGDRRVLKSSLTPADRRERGFVDLKRQFSSNQVVNDEARFSIMPPHRQ